MIFSCKGCPERHPGCHDHCETYQKEKAEYQAMKDRIDKETAIRQGLTDQQFRAVKKACSSHGKRIGYGKG